MLNKNKIKVGVHNGTFHADDVLCVTMLADKYGIENIEVFRTRDENILAKCDYVLDVGGKDLVSDKQIRFDHHQNDSEYYENGVKMAACGKLARYLYKDEPELLEELKKNILYSVEAPDNGQSLRDFNLPASRFTYVQSMVADWTEDVSKNDEYFMDTVKMSLPILQKEKQKAKSTILARQEVLEACQKADKDSHIIVLNKHMPWENTVVDFNNQQKSNEKIEVVMFKGIDGWTLYSVPDEKGAFSPAYFPAEWAGLRFDELAKQTGFKSSVFCHTGRFVAIFEDKEEALRAAYGAVIRHKEEQLKINNLGDDAR